MSQIFPAAPCNLALPAHPAQRGATGGAAAGGSCKGRRPIRRARPQCGPGFNMAQLTAWRTSPAGLARVRGWNARRLRPWQLRWGRSLPSSRVPCGLGIGVPAPGVPHLCEAQLLLRESLLRHAPSGLKRGCAGRSKGRRRELGSCHLVERSTRSAGGKPASRQFQWCFSKFGCAAVTEVVDTSTAHMGVGACGVGW